MLIGTTIYLFVSKLMSSEIKNPTIGQLAENKSQIQNRMKELKNEYVSQKKLIKSEYKWRIISMKICRNDWKN
jgi:hypothetical protein